MVGTFFFGSIPSCKLAQCELIKPRHILIQLNICYQWLTSVSMNKRREFFKVPSRLMCQIFLLLTQLNAP
nr:MAG TPA: hypothetical protein [Caudoviricetes sp.]